MHDFSRLTALQRISLREWTSAADLDKLFTLNKAYINGDLDLHPAHLVPLAGETQGLVKPLITMNEYGMFTFHGQPGVKSIGGLPPHCHGRYAGRSLGFSEPQDNRTGGA